MKNWMIAAVMALTTVSGLASAEEGTRGYASPQPSNCSDGSCCTPCAQTCGNNCCGLRCCGHWELEGQALYWRTCADDETYAINQTATAQDFKTVVPANEWGFRVKGKYTTCDGCKFASLSYLYFDQTDRARTLNPSITSYFDSNLLSIDAKIGAEYQRVDGHLGHYICQGCRGGFYGYGGVSWIYILNDQKLTAFTSDFFIQFVKQRSRYTAAGFEAGVGGHCKICGGFGLAAELGGIAALGERKVNFLFRSFDPITPGVTLNKRPDLLICVPGIDLKLEAFYECCWCGLNWGLMVGYEQHYYFNPMKLNSLFFGIGNVLEPSVFVNYKDFGVGGLYFGAKVGY